MLEKITTSYALSKEAYDKGIRVESLFSWYDIPESEKDDIAFRGKPVLLNNQWGFSYSGEKYKKGRKEEINNLVKSKYRYPAPTASEWLELLPSRTKCIKSGGYYLAEYSHVGVSVYVYEGVADTLQDALCKLAIKLKEEGLI